jgi:hypothetical protein
MDKSFLVLFFKKEPLRFLTCLKGMCRIMVG